MEVKKNKIEEIIVYNRILASYRKAFCNKLAGKLSFTFIHGYNDSGIDQSEGYYSSIVRLYKWGSFETQVFIGGLWKIINRNVKIIVYESAIGILSLPVAIIISKILGKKIVLWSHGYNRKKGFNPDNSIGDKYRLLLMKAADRVLVYSESDQKLLSNFLGASKVYVIHNTVDTDSLFLIRDKLDNEGRSNVRDRLGMSGKFNITFIGRLIESKRPMDLIKLLTYLKDEDVVINFIGDGPLKKDMLKIVDDNNLHTRVKFHGSVYDNLLSGEILFASDVMIIPGAIGLSLNHAYCFDCPVITYDPEQFLGHGPEIDYLDNNITGFLIEKEDVRQMSKCIGKYMKDEKKQKEIRSNVRKKITQQCSIDQMVCDFIEATKF